MNPTSRDLFRIVAMIAAAARRRAAGAAVDRGGTRAIAGGLPAPRQESKVHPTRPTGLTRLPIRPALTIGGGSNRKVLP